MKMAVTSSLVSKIVRSIRTQISFRYWSSAFAILVAVFALAVPVGASGPPYPTRPAIESIAWYWNVHTTAVPGSDLCPVTKLNLVKTTLPLSQADIDMQKARKIRDKQRRREPLTPEEAAYMERVREHRRKLNEAYKKAHPPRDMTGLMPLTDLGKETYKGQEGGLYPGGGNVPPEGHLKAGLKLARQIVPLDPEGNSSTDGKIVFLSIGMSNTTQEFQVFKKMAEADAEINAQVAIVDGAQGGQTAKITANANARFWQVIDQRLEKANVTPKQVQAVWIKQANAGPNRPFPEEVKLLQGHLVTNLHILADRFPNLKIAYLSSRIYAGYAETPLNPEPHAYESAFAVKWLIADQIAGKPELNYDPEKGSVKSPWLAWGPYLWADGVKGRSDELIYTRKDLAQDGTHPAMSGREKVAKQLLAFLKSDPTARLWFVKSEGKD